jgi:putative Holliday junction resolvase
MNSPRISAIALDIGKKRIGVAGCDGLGLAATGLVTIDRKSIDYVIQELRDIVRDRKPTVLVVGFPFNMDGSVGSQAKQTVRMADILSKAVGLPIEYVDERLSSIEAEDLIKAENLSPSQNKGLIDRKAAALILERWLAGDDRVEGKILVLENVSKTVVPIDPN